MSSVIATVHVVYRTGDAMEVKLVSDVPIGIKANERTSYLPGKSNPTSAGSASYQAKLKYLA